MAKSEKDSGKLNIEQLNQKIRWNIREIAKYDPNRNPDAEIKDALAIPDNEKMERLEQLRQELNESKGKILIPIAPNKFLSLKELREKLQWNIREYGRLNSDYNFEDELKTLSKMTPQQMASRLIELRNLREHRNAPPPRASQNQMQNSMNRYRIICVA